jgi:hypothetical protein
MRLVISSYETCEDTPEIVYRIELIDNVKHYTGLNFVEIQDIEVVAQTIISFLKQK